MVLFKALFLGALVTAVLFLLIALVIWMLPLLGFLAVFVLASILAYAMFLDADRPSDRFTKKGPGD